MVSSCKQARPQNQIPRPAHAQALRHWRLQTHAKLQLQCHSKLFKTRHCCCCSTNNWTTVTNHITNCDNRLTPNPTHLCWPAMDGPHPSLKLKTRSLRCVLPFYTHRRLKHTMQAPHCSADVWVILRQPSLAHSKYTMYMLP